MGHYTESLRVVEPYRMSVSAANERKLAASFEALVVDVSGPAVDADPLLFWHSIDRRSGSEPKDSHGREPYLFLLWSTFRVDGVRDAYLGRTTRPAIDNIGRDCFLTL